MRLNYLKEIKYDQFGIMKEKSGILVLLISLGVLTESENSRRYWNDLKRKLKDEEGVVQLYENIVQLKMKATDGKMRSTDVADMQGIFRIIQSVPSPKAEPFKMWLAEVGKERIDDLKFIQISGIY